MLEYYTYTNSDEYPSHNDTKFDTKEEALNNINKEKEKYQKLMLWKVEIDGDNFITMDKVCKITKKENGDFAWLWFM